MTSHRVVIIGGGISGLAAAFRLQELSRENGRPLDMTLLEATDRLGGVIETETREGFLLEGGPDAFLSEKPQVLDLCKRLGISDEIIETEEKNRRSKIVRKGKLVEIPKGFYLTAPSNFSGILASPLLSWRGKLRMAADFWIPARRKDGEDESVAGFIRRRFGKETLESIGQPMIGGIYTGDPERLSLQATFPQFRVWEREYGSILRALSSLKTRKASQTENASGPRYSLFLSFKKGMGTLIDALAGKLEGVRLRMNAFVTGLAPGGEGWRIALRGGEMIEADAVCVTCSAPRAAGWMESFAPELAEGLRAIPCESAATVNLGFRAGDLRRRPEAFGFVCPEIEKRRILACTFTSVKFAGRSPEDAVLLRVFLGGVFHPEVLRLDDSEIERLVRQEIGELLGIRAQPLFVSIRRYPESMPQYLVGHLDRLASLEKSLERYPGLYLAGNAYRGVGIPDCIRTAEEMADRMIRYFQNIPYETTRHR